LAGRNSKEKSSRRFGGKKFKSQFGGKKFNTVDRRRPSSLHSVQRRTYLLISTHRIEHYSYSVEYRQHPALNSKTNNCQVLICFRMVLREIEGIPYRYNPEAKNKKGCVTISCCMWKLDDDAWITANMYRSLRWDKMQCGKLPRCRGRMKFFLPRPFGAAELVKEIDHDCSGNFPSMTSVARLLGLDIACRDDAFVKTRDNDDATMNPNDKDIATIGTEGGDEMVIGDDVSTDDAKLVADGVDEMTGGNDTSSDNVTMMNEMVMGDDVATDDAIETRTLNNDDVLDANANATSNSSQDDQAAAVTNLDNSQMSAIGGGRTMGVDYDASDEDADGSGAVDGGDDDANSVSSTKSYYRDLCMRLTFALEKKNAMELQLRIKNKRLEEEIAELRR
jgi:hypothetical protein